MSGGRLAAAVLVGLVGLVALPRGTPAQAQSSAPGDDQQAEAEKRFQAAEALYKSREYLAAAAEYQAAYDLSGLPGLLYNVAQSYRLGGEKRKAAETYRLFLERAPDHQLASVARGHLEALERELAASDGQQAPPPAVPGPQEPADASLSAAGTPPVRGRGLRIAGLVSAGVGLVALGAALHYGIEAKKASDAISENQEAWSRSLLDRYDEGQSAETRMFILSGVGAGALVAGGVLYYLGWRAGRDEQSVTVTAATGGAALSVGGRF